MFGLTPATAANHKFGQEAAETTGVVVVRLLSVRSRLIRVIGFLGWLLTAAHALPTLLAVKTAMMKQRRGALEHTSRRRQELEILYDPTNANNGLSPATSRSDQVVECVFAS